MNLPAIISGAHATKVGSLPGSSCLSLHDEAAAGAIVDAGIEPADIDGVICAYSLTEPHLMLASWFCEFFGHGSSVIIIERLEIRLGLDFAIALGLRPCY